MLHVDLVHRAAAEDCRTIEQQETRASGHGHSRKKCLASIEQRLKDVSAPSRFVLDIGCDRRGFRRYNGPKQRFLVGKVVVERTACKASRGNDLRRARRRISLFDEEVARCGKKLRPAFVGTLPIGPSPCLFLHACSLYVSEHYIHNVCLSSPEGKRP